MNSSHYPSLELCKKLTEARFPATEKGYPHNTGSEYYVCPSVMELLDVIPIRICVNNKGYFLDFIPGSIKYTMRYRDNGEYNGENVIFRVEDTLPNALAEMILWLYENKFISFTK